MPKRGEEEIGEEEIAEKLREQFESTIRELELHSDNKIDQLYIGKTFISRRRKRGGGFQKFDPLDHKTWIKQGISSRWDKHKASGRDGLVVLCAITKDTVPKGCQDEVHQEDFTLAMEQKLLYYYKVSHPDKRVVNDTFSTGKQSSKHHAYAVYVAFKYKQR